MFLDLKMPAVDGYDVLEWLQRRPELQSILVIAFSGWAQLADVNRAYDLGARSFLTKPCTEGDLANLQMAFPDYWEAAVMPGLGIDSA